MAEAVLGLVGVAGAGVLGWAALDRWRRRRVRRRLEAGGRRLAEAPVHRRPLVPRHRAAALLLGSTLAVAASLALSAPLPYPLAAAALGAALGWVVDDRVAEQRLLGAEQQLADALDLLVAALHAGAGLGAALEDAAAAARRPLQPLLEDMGRRLRLGDAPDSVFREPAARVPRASFRLFGLSLGAQYETGGSLAPSLSLVGRSVRDRLALGRRVASQTTAAVASVIGILAIAYGIGLLMWLWDPARSEEFLTTSVGAWLVSGTMGLQALGLLWMWKIAQIRI